MTVVLCDLVDCSKHGLEVCRADRIKLVEGEPTCYEPISKLMKQAPSNPRCHKTSNGFKSNSTGMVLK